MKLAVSLAFARDRKIRVGTLFSSGRDTAFEYDADFKASGLNPSPFRLPVKNGMAVYDFSGGMETFGMFEDSLPDGWGRRLVDAAFRKEEGRIPTVMERLAMVGGGGMGALVYEPADERSAAETTWDFDALVKSAVEFDEGRAEDVLSSVRAAGGSSGGARPKAFIGYNPENGEVCPERDELPPGFEHWLVKFNTRRDGADAGRREFQYYEMAVAAGAVMAPCRIIETPSGAFFATKRFDRTSDGGRLHFASAAGLLHADFRVPGDEYAVLFKLTDALTRDYSAKCEMFRRAALNVLAHNRDDHLKNFGFLMNADGRWSLAPFYDFTYSDGPNGWQTLSVAGEGANPGERDLLRLAEAADIRAADAAAVLEQVKTAVRTLSAM